MYLCSDVPDLEIKFKFFENVGMPQKKKILIKNDETCVKLAQDILAT